MPAKDDNISRDKDTPDWQKLISVYTPRVYVHLLRVPCNILSANKIEKLFMYRSVVVRLASISYCSHIIKQVFVFSFQGARVQNSAKNLGVRDRTPSSVPR